MHTLAIGTLGLVAVLALACDADGTEDRTPLSAGQRATGDPATGEDDADAADDARDAQGGGHGLDTPVEVAEHTLGEDRGFVVTATVEDTQVCLTATELGDGGDRRSETAVTDCASPDTPLDLRVLELGEDLTVLAGVVTDPRAADVTLFDTAGAPVPDEADAVPLVELSGSGHRAFAAASAPDRLERVELSDADGTVIGERKVSSASRVGRPAH
jgi:hypothetical protein